MAAVQENDLERTIYQEMEKAAKLGEQELETELNTDNIFTKSYHIREAGKAAEIAGWKKHQIAQKLWEIVEKHGYNISRNLVQKVCSPLGYTDDSMARHTSDVIVTSENSSAFAAENADVIDIADAMIDWWTAFKKKAQEGPFESRMTHKEWPEQKYLLRKAAEVATKDLDNRRISSEETQPLFVLCYKQGSIQLASKLYVLRIKELAEMVTKQGSKILGGMARDCHFIYDPKSMLEAIGLYYVGVPCPSCSGWRVHPHKTKSGWLWCYGCETEFPRELKTLPLLRKVVMDN